MKARCAYELALAFGTTNPGRHPKRIYGYANPVANTDWQTQSEAAYTCVAPERNSWGVAVALGHSVASTDLATRTPSTLCRSCTTRDPGDRRGLVRAWSFPLALVISKKDNSGSVGLSGISSLGTLNSLPIPRIFGTQNERPTGRRRIRCDGRHQIQVAYTKAYVPLAEASVTFVRSHVWASPRSWTTAKRSQYLRAYQSRRLAIRPERRSTHLSMAFDSST